ncbi:E3 ubiquitin-protein ligase MARCHF1-like isoform X2 [Argopecten irradians]|uniref:E3 ubiquitin-protein ligase MARCHF1-like isoform X2 n=1 Tax=Argopecten irradians TaxID=31199 RepID=UPI0037229D4E
MEISPVEISLSDLQTQTVGSEKTREHPDDPQETGSVASGLSKSDEAACSKKLASMKSVEMKCETEQIVQLGKDGEAAQASETGLSSSSSSSDETVCRICQGSNKDTEEPIQTTRCACKGAIANIHQSCLREWVRHQRSVRCEICRGRFSGISPPGSLERIVERRLGNVMPAEDITESVHQLYYHISRLQPFTRRRRAAIAASIVFLSMVTCMSAIMTVKADRDYRQVSRDPWSTHHDIDQSGLFLSICVASASFSGTLTIGVVLIWIGVELSAFLQRRAVYRRVERRVLQRMNRPDVINI